MVGVTSRWMLKVQSLKYGFGRFGLSARTACPTKSVSREGCWMPPANGLSHEPPTGGVFGSGFGGPRKRKFDTKPPLPKSVAAAFTPTNVEKKIPAPARMTVLSAACHARPTRGEKFQYCGFSW